ncbi:gyf domain containing protein [Grosmannia clavigera kw1407]|uniref:Gyf domain containing protein n=1 Tax=Grosmannia clavigera (strain kw1407 / UAMH 11150) TaxID=655863 RepID=F0XTF9_GROCL|nr:gyf domain containing protein [Grosmannia clavigera kw1407]EFW98589.1 gyf domain containing protein [Grosmannia clavigera kw1407]
MASRYSAARPKRASEVFARQHHGEQDADSGMGDGATSKKVKFDVRNPSALAPDAREEDDVLEADVIGVGAAATKRGAVNIDGYDSDSENETFNARAEQRVKKGGKAGSDGADVDLIDQLDNYNDNLKGSVDGGKPGVDADDEDDDMFAEEDGNEDEGAAKEGGAGAGKKWKEVRFLDDSNIEGQEDTSKSGGHVRLDDESSSDEEDIAQEILEEGVDEEVGPGGLKKHAPKIEAFNMKQEQEDGAFDEAGNYIRKAADPDAVHDSWLEGVSKKQMKKAASAHQRREADVRQQRREDDSILTADLIAALIMRLNRTETSLEALARLGRGLHKTKAKKIPKWKLKRQAGSASTGATESMDVDKDKAPEDPEQAKAKAAIDAITEAADRLLNREFPDIYDMERERLVREYRAESGEPWVEPPQPSSLAADADDSINVEAAESSNSNNNNSWEYRWTDGRDGGKIQGPYDGPTMKAWQEAGYFVGDIEFRPAGRADGWRRVVSFI